MNEPIRIAMWSGPRNISTALMRAWENRADTAVIDEPFYAYYLAQTGEPHPGAAEVIALGETDWRKVVAQLIGPAPEGRRVFYQKQMTHHLLPEIDRGWLREVVNCFLIRDPREVIASYLKKNHEPSVEDLGFAQQAALFEWVRAETGQIPPVIDGRDVLEQPEKTLRLLCEAVGLEFDGRMLSWPPGARATDGMWAKHWYAEVKRTTGFQPYVAKEIELPAQLEPVEDECRAFYERLFRERLK